MYVLLILLLIGLGFLLFFNFEANREQQQAIEDALAAESVTPTPPPTETPVPTAEPIRNAQTVTLAFAGDVVGQAGLTTAAQGEGESYDFGVELAGVQSSLSEADLAACTLVSTLTNDGGYDAYRMPGAMAAGLKSAGFDLVNAATDHLLDRGLTGLVDTVDLLQRSGLGVMGAYSSSTGRHLPMVELGGVKVAFLSYTYGTAGTGAQPVSVADNSWCIDLLTTDYMTGKETVDYAKIDWDIAAVRDAGADVVVCFLYWWDSAQYYTQPRAQQTEVVDSLCERGVDIVVGGGVKVPQPIEVRTVDRGDRKVNCVVCYSLSNLMSCFNDANTNISAVVDITISKDTDTGEVWISGVEGRPLFMLDTDDYDDAGSAAGRYMVLDSRQTVSAYDQGLSGYSQQVYDAVKTGMDDVAAIMGEEFFAEGGETLPFPY